MADNSNAMSSLIERIEERCEDLDISESEAEKRARLSRSWIHDLRRGKKRNPSYSSLAALANALGCNVIWLAEGRGDKLAGPQRDGLTDAIIRQLEDYPDDERRAILRLLSGGSLKDIS